VGEKGGDSDVVLRCDARGMATMIRYDRTVLGFQKNPKKSFHATHGKSRIFPPLAAVQGGQGLRGGLISDHKILPVSELFAGSLEVVLARYQIANERLHLSLS
jgi:hypothetical protein